MLSFLDAYAVSYTSRGSGESAFSRTSDGGLAAVPSGPPLGSIDIIIGPMFAGKSTYLLQWVRKEQQSGRTAALIKSSIDTRYTCQHITTHAGDKLPCVACDRLMPLLVNHSIMSKDVIAVDEAQFFPDLVEFVSSAAENHGKKLLVCGLDADFKR